MPTLTVNIPDDQNIEDTLDAVISLIGDGYTSGFYPTWWLK